MGASHLDLFDQPGINCTTLRLQLESPLGGFPASNFNSFMARDRDVAANLPDIYQLGGRSQSLFDSQVTCTQAVCFSQEHTFTSRPAASTSSV